MSDLSTYTSVFRANAGYRAKRNRQPVSCTTCQRRKTRCDRKQPCYACWQRGDADNCRFGPADDDEGGSENRAEGPGAVNGSRKEVQARLTKLEDIVKELASGSESASRKRPRSRKDDGDGLNGDAHEATGQGTSLRVDRTDGVYSGPTSWSSLVANIRDIQHLLDTESEDAEGDRDSLPLSVGEETASLLPPGIPECFLAAPVNLNLEMILKALPPRQDADKLVTTFFNAKFVAIPFIHTHQFRRQYDAFWEDPGSASYLWVSILFSILSLGMSLLKYSPHIRLSGETPIAEPSKYLILAAQCFIAGEYFRAKPLSVEALLMHVHSRNVCLDDSHPSVWTFYGLALRVAQRQGYHREMVKVSARATPFAAEMRRRTWFMLRSMDLLHSSQQGMPPMVDPALCDTQIPTNLTDEDFDEDTVILPPARPNTDPLPILAYITKAPLCAILDKVLRLALATGPRLYSDVLALHAELAAWHDSVPACYRVRPIKSTSFTDPGYTIMHRIMLEAMYLKTLCILHREYLGAGTRRNSQYQTSIQTCNEAAERLIAIHVELNQEIQPGGRLYEDRYMVNSLTLHDFLIAAMVLCVELSEADAGMSSSERARKISVLRSATNIWEHRSKTSREASHAARVLKAILQKVDTPSPATSSQLDTPDTTSTIQNAKPMDPAPTYSAHEWHMNLGDDAMFDPFSGGNSTLDWTSIDEFLRNGDAGNPYWASGGSDGC